jgi:flavodoxin short chain
VWQKFAIYFYLKNILKVVYESKHIYKEKRFMKVNIIYWSGTGNTEAMANAVAEGIVNGGGEANVIPVASASDDGVNCDVLMLGCPAMGAESLEDGEFEPYYQSIKDKLNGKKVGLFGSYDWGDGEWMRTWQQDVEGAGAIMVDDGLTVNNTPDEDGLAACRSLGEKAVK